MADFCCGHRLVGTQFLTQLLISFGESSMHDDGVAILVLVLVAFG
jgi:hypothetical protein